MNESGLGQQARHFTSSAELPQTEPPASPTSKPLAPHLQAAVIYARPEQKKPARPGSGPSLLSDDWE